MNFLPSGQLKCLCDILIKVQYHFFNLPLEIFHQRPDPLPCAGRGEKHRRGGVSFPDILQRFFPGEIKNRGHIGFGHRHRRGYLKHEGVFQGLIVSLRQGQQHKIAAGPGVKLRRTHQVPDVFQDHHVQVFQPQRFQRLLRHLPGDMAGPARVHLDHLHAQGSDGSGSTMLEHANLARKKISPSHLVPMGIYNEDDSKRLGREKDLEMKMHKALENGDFVPYLQPKYELNKETIAGAEALVRWIDPEEGMIFPNEFIPLFEKNGFVVEIDLYMFEEACKLVEKWHKN